MKEVLVLQGNFSYSTYVVTITYNNSSHWEKRTLNNEIMNGYSSRYYGIWYNYTACITGYRDYEVLSEFTLAFLEDTGWYKANYTALSELSQNSLRWGRGTAHSICTTVKLATNGCRFRMFIYYTKL